jgi:hypothetical protein
VWARQPGGLKASSAAQYPGMLVSGPQSPVANTSPGSVPPVMYPTSPPSVVYSWMPVGAGPPSAPYTRSFRCSMYAWSPGDVAVWPYDPYSFSIWTMATGPPLATVHGLTTGRKVPHHRSTAARYVVSLVRSEMPVSLRR